MGKQWKRAGKIENAAAKGALISKLAKELTVATRLGGPDPDMNSRLRLAIRDAKSASVPKDTIERAIKKGNGELGGDQIEEVLYEGYGPHQVGILVECQTDNRARTAPEMKFIFKKHGGNLGEQGSVAWMFDRVSYVVGTPAQPNVDPDEEAIESGANEVFPEEEGSFGFYGAPEDLSEIQNNLTSRGWEIQSTSLAYKPKNYTDLSPEQGREVQEFMEALDSNEDVSKIYATLDFDKL